MDFLLFEYSLYFNQHFLREGLQDCLQIRLTENKNKKIVTLLEKSEKYITTHTFIIFFIFFLLAASFDADIMIWKEGNGGQWSEPSSWNSFLKH